MDGRPNGMMRLVSLAAAIPSEGPNQQSKKIGPMGCACTEGVRMYLGRASTVRRRGRRRVLILVLAPLLVGCAAAGVVQPRGGASNQFTQIGLTNYSARERHPAPGLSGTTLANTPFTLSSLAGNVVVINVWASWCAPCRTESPDLARTAKQLAAQPVRFLGIDEADSSGPARAFVASSGASYPELVDGDGDLLRRLRVLPQAAIPSTLLLDRHGRIADRVIGPVTGAQIRALVTALLNES